MITSHRLRLINTTRAYTPMSLFEGEEYDMRQRILALRKQEASRPDLEKDILPWSTVGFSVSITILPCPAIPITPSSPILVIDPACSYNMRIPFIVAAVSNFYNLVLGPVDLTLITTTIPGFQCVPTTTNSMILLLTPSLWRLKEKSIIGL